MSERASKILNILRAEPLTAPEICSRLGISQPTFSRELKVINGYVVAAGKGRARRYYRKRELRQLENEECLPIFRVKQEGQVEKIAELFPVFPQGCFLVQDLREYKKTNQNWTFYESLPWWLADMRPQGYLGRAFARYLCDEQQELVDVDPRNWDDDTVLFVLARYPKETIGNLLIGEEAYQAWFSLQEEPSLSELEVYRRANSDDYFGSSAQGEQPKLLAKMEQDKYIIKFSGEVSQTQVESSANRWSDLLKAEALASEILNEHSQGIACESRVFHVEKRTFLAVKRFDRIGELGRKGVISLSSLDAEFVGKGSSSWPEIVHELANQKVVTRQAELDTQWVWAFGQLISNSDMHLGNLSVLVDEGRPYQLAPIYDMLPMYFAPKANGDLPSEPRVTQINSVVSKESWQVAFELAVSYWQRVLACDEISTHFKVVAELQLQQVETFASAIERMA
ncbi:MULTISPECIES: type II toxin-antitoxin system HipA family toxin YjjJ [Gammaproteobacteria]|uniref:type II toxin-antitoxin system HipA family toxin YjjJ n=1 Tax=Gammaproteobacteria TaxID=1236 RepID=UPI000DCFCD92|nr:MULTISPECIES: type II toxin-antitoxin system HipA family toxin YjjJ [Gammaproteobacteria]RTE85855.1 type II toxin-antitoxin system HipA family toxinoxin YjjJ [Aliidiomarina sp. B3213]TCZ90145.1 type II toxin-antitoxin system HipA family toxinoxin YjjJ [Lysobacter sp. N42]